MGITLPALFNKVKLNKRGGLNLCQSAPRPLLGLLVRYAAAAARAFASGITLGLFRLGLYLFLLCHMSFTSFV